MYVCVCVHVCVFICLSGGRDCELCENGSTHQSVIGGRREWECVLDGDADWCHLVNTMYQSVQ